MENDTTQPAPAPAPAAAPSPSGRGFLFRHSLGVGIAAGVLAVVVVAGGTAWGVSAAVAGTQTTASAPMSPVDASTPSAAKHATHAAKHHKRKVHGARGTISAISGDTWTLKTAAGKTVTVKLTSTTAFGTKKAPAKRDSFAVGTKIDAIGKRSDETVTATRIVHLPLHALLHG